MCCVRAGVLCVVCALCICVGVMYVYNSRNTLHGGDVVHLYPVPFHHPKYVCHFNENSLIPRAIYIILIVWKGQLETRSLFKFVHYTWNYKREDVGTFCDLQKVGRSMSMKPTFYLKIYL